VVDETVTRTVVVDVRVLEGDGMLVMGVEVMSGVDETVKSVEETLVERLGSWVLVDETRDSSEVDEEVKPTSEVTLVGGLVLVDERRGRVRVQ
jgi:hypothetical protein